ncbi:MAG: tripartite tricarboxylate transporter substrate-binding protein [Proteobacteria bacterium]|nr:tripartite tricarboxylate transporter substrate-binding protein [Pseudomonadota bacterium]
MKKNIRLTSIAAAVAFGFAAISAPVIGAEEIFKDKTIGVLIGFGAGGGYDHYGRQLARHIGKQLPGNPNVVAVNMPGAGGFKLINYLYNVAPKDGTEMGIFARGAPLLAFAGGAKQVRFDPLKLTWIGTSSSYAGEAYLLAVRKDTGMTSFKDIQRTRKELNFASTGAGSDGHDVPLILRDVFNINAQVVRGYPGGNTLYLAVDRGEMDARMVGYSSVKVARDGWLKKDGPVNFLMQFATNKRLPQFPDVPTAQELVTNDEDRALITLLETPFFMARPFAGPPNIPADRVKILRAAFMAAHDDPAYKKQAKRLRLLVSPKNGAEVQGLVEQLGKMPRKLFDRYASILANPKSKLRKVNWIKVSGIVTKTGKKGRFAFKIDGKGKDQKARMRGSYTKIKVGGKEAKSKAVMVGMNCNIWWEGPKSTPGRVECAQ